MRFDSLPISKQHNILCSAFSCFAKNGYKKTSIADIAVSADISKASIFQYFGSKKQLYLFLFKFSSDKIIAAFPAGSDDFFDCLKIASDTKLAVMSRYPGMLDFLASVVTETDEDVLEDIKACSALSINDVLSGFFCNVNWDKLKPDVDKNMLINTVTWVNEGYLRTFIGHKSPDLLRSELLLYMNLIKNAFYKEEFL